MSWSDCAHALRSLISHPCLNLDMHRDASVSAFYFPLHVILFKLIQNLRANNMAMNLEGKFKMTPEEPERKHGDLLSKRLLEIEPSQAGKTALGLTQKNPSR